MRILRAVLWLGKETPSAWSYLSSNILGTFPSLSTRTECVAAHYKTHNCKCYGPFKQYNFHMLGSLVGRVLPDEATSIFLSLTVSA